MAWEARKSVAPVTRIQELMGIVLETGDMMIKGTVKLVVGYIWSLRGAIYCFLDLLQTLWKEGFICLAHGCFTATSVHVRTR